MTTSHSTTVQFKCSKNVLNLRQQWNNPTESIQLLPGITCWYRQIKQFSKTHTALFKVPTNSPGTGNRSEIRNGRRPMSMWGSGSETEVCFPVQRVLFSENTMNQCVSSPLSCSSSRVTWRRHHHMPAPCLPTYPSGCLTPQHPAVTRNTLTHTGPLWQANRISIHVDGYRCICIQLRGAARKIFLVGLEKYGYRHFSFVFTYFAKCTRCIIFRIYFRFGVGLCLSRPIVATPHGTTSRMCSVISYILWDILIMRDWE